MSINGPQKLLNAEGAVGRAYQALRLARAETELLQSLRTAEQILAEARHLAYLITDPEFDGGYAAAFTRFISNTLGVHVSVTGYEVQQKVIDFYRKEQR